MNSGVLPMNYDNAVDLIDHLIDQQADKYFADFVPFTFQNEDYAELEMYLNVHFKPRFAEKNKIYCLRADVPARVICLLRWSSG